MISSKMEQYFNSFKYWFNQIGYFLIKIAALFSSHCWMDSTLDQIYLEHEISSSVDVLTLTQLIFPILFLCSFYNFYITIK
jgi:hypothetical protein